MTVAEILQRSSNVGAVTIAETKLGQTPLLNWIHQFGFGQPTGIDFPVRARACCRRWSGSTIGTRRSARGVRDDDPARVGVRRDRERRALGPAAPPRPRPGGAAAVAPHAADPLPRRRPGAADDAEGVVSDVGTAAAAEIPGYSVAGKTGTAQKPGAHGYIPGKYVATFVGMVPASNPRLVVLVTVDEPTLAIFGGVVAAPAFAQIAAFDLQYLEVSPDQPLH